MLTQKSALSDSNQPQATGEQQLTQQPVMPQIGSLRTKDARLRSVISSPALTLMQPSIAGMGATGGTAQPATVIVSDVRPIVRTRQAKSITSRVRDFLSSTSISDSKKSEKAKSKGVIDVNEVASNWWCQNYRLLVDEIKAVCSAELLKATEPKVMLEQHIQWYSLRLLSLKFQELEHPSFKPFSPTIKQDINRAQRSLVRWLNPSIESQDGGSVWFMNVNSVMGKKEHLKNAREQLGLSGEYFAKFMSIYNELIKNEIDSAIESSMDEMVLTHQITSNKGCLCNSINIKTKIDLEYRKTIKRLPIKTTRV